MAVALIIRLVVAAVLAGVASFAAVEMRPAGDAVVAESAPSASSCCYFVIF